MARDIIGDFSAIPTFFAVTVPTYKAANYGRVFVTIKWSDVYAPKIRALSERRSGNRIANYLDASEIARAKDKLQTSKSCALRFGVKKTGTGQWKGQRGDFCLIGGSIDGKHLTLFYRSIELIGGFAFDIVLIDELSKRLGIRFRSVTIMAAHGLCFARRGNSSEKLYPKLRRIFFEEHA